MHGLLIILRDTALFVVVGILVLLFLSLLGALSQSKSFLASFPLVLLGPVLPLLSRLGLNVVDWYSPSTQAGVEGSGVRFRTVRQAMDYLVNRIVDEAKLQGTPLTDVERKMLYFSERDTTLRDMPAVSAEFSRNYDEDEYEQKIGGLVRRITTRDQRQDNAAQQAWDEAVSKVSEGDYYLLVLMGAHPAGTSNVRPPHDILKLWITVIGIVFGGLALIGAGNWIFGPGFTGWIFDRYHFLLLLLLAVIILVLRSSLGGLLRARVGRK